MIRRVRSATGRSAATVAVAWLLLASPAMAEPVVAVLLDDFGGAFEAAGEYPAVTGLELSHHTRL